MLEFNHTNCTHIMVCFHKIFCTSDCFVYGTRCILKTYRVFENMHIIIVFIGSEKITEQYEFFFCLKIKIKRTEKSFTFQRRTFGEFLIVLLRTHVLVGHIDKQNINNCRFMYISNIEDCISSYNIFSFNM